MRLPRRLLNLSAFLTWSTKICYLRLRWNTLHNNRAIEWVLCVAWVLHAHVFTVQEAIDSTLDVVPNLFVNFVLLQLILQRFLFWFRLHLDIITWVALVTTGYIWAETHRVWFVQGYRSKACHVAVHSLSLQLYSDVDFGDIFLRCLPTLR